MTSEEITYPPRTVCKVLGIPHGTLSTWANRGYMANFDAAFATHGKARMFTKSDVFALALIKEISDRGLKLPELIQFAPDVAEAYLQHGGAVVTEVHILQYADQVTIRYNDEAMQKPADPDYRSRYSFNLAQIFAGIEEALDAVVASGQADRAARLEELDPTIEKISRFYSGG